MPSVLVVTPRRPGLGWAVGLAAFAAVATGFAVWLDVDMARADQIRVEVAPLVVYGAVLGIGLLCLTVAAAAGHSRSARAHTVSRWMTRVSLAASGVLTVGLGPGLMFWLASWPLSLVFD